MLYSENLGLLEYIRRKLHSKGIKATLNRSMEAGQEVGVGRFNNDYWCLGVYAKQSLLKVLEGVKDRLSLPWKRLLAELAIRALRKQLAWSEVEEIVSEIKRLKQRTLEVSRCCILAGARR